MKKIKPWMWIVGAVVLVLAIAFTVCAIVLPVTYDIDESLIVEDLNPSVTLTEQDGYTTLVKVGGSFKVLGFTDMHLDHKQEKGNYTMEFFLRNVVEEKPDLVILDGDNFTSSFNERRARQFAKIMEQMGIYWAFVLGNHEGDNIWSISRERMVRILSEYPHCLTDASVKYTSSGEEVWGYGNFIINLADENGKISQSLIFMDSGADITEADAELYAEEMATTKHSTADYVKESQITWYKESIQKLQSLYGGIYSTVYIHIPLPEYVTAYESITGETEVTTEPPEAGISDAQGNRLLLGARYENICCSGHNSGLFEAIKESGSTQAIFVGHDHVNNFIVRYQGIILGYNQPSGYSVYNLYTKGISDTLQQGYTYYGFGSDGALSVGQVVNADLYPERQEEIKALY